jgi:hypothetical protein
VKELAILPSPAGRGREVKKGEEEGKKQAARQADKVFIGVVDWGTQERWRSAELWVGGGAAAGLQLACLLGLAQRAGDWNRRQVAGT